MRYLLTIITVCFITIINGQIKGINLNDKMSISARKEANDIINRMIQTGERSANQMYRLRALGMDEVAVLRQLKGKKVVAINDGSIPDFFKKYIKRQDSLEKIKMDSLIINQKIKRDSLIIKQKKVTLWIKVLNSLKYLPEMISGIIIFFASVGVFLSSKKSKNSDDKIN